MKRGERGNQLSMNVWKAGHLAGLMDGWLAHKSRGEARMEGVTGKMDRIVEGRNDGVM